MQNTSRPHACSDITYMSQENLPHPPSAWVRLSWVYNWRLSYRLGAWKWSHLCCSHAACKIWWNYPFLHWSSYVHGLNEREREHSESYMLFRQPPQWEAGFSAQENPHIFQNMGATKDVSNWEGEMALDLQTFQVSQAGEELWIVSHLECIGINGANQSHPCFQSPPARKKSWVLRRPLCIHTIEHKYLAGLAFRLMFCFDSEPVLIIRLKILYSIVTPICRKENGTNQKLIASEQAGTKM